MPDQIDLQDVFGIGRNVTKSYVEAQPGPEAEAMIRLGQIYEELGDQSEARKWYREGMRKARQADDRSVQQRASQLLRDLSSPH
jgi:hypothetical protein